MKQSRGKKEESWLSRRYFQSLLLKLDSDLFLSVVPSGRVSKIGGEIFHQKIKYENNEIKIDNRKSE